MITNVYTYTSLPNTAALRHEMSHMQPKPQILPSPVRAPPCLLEVAILVNLVVIIPRFRSHSMQDYLAFLALYK